MKTLQFSVLRKQIFSIIFLNIFSIVSAQKAEINIQKEIGFSEAKSKEYFSKNTLDPIEGIWQTKDGFKLAIERKIENGKRSSKKYQAIVISTIYKSDFWKSGYIRIQIEKTANANIFYAETTIAGYDATDMQTGKATLSGNQNILSVNLPKSDKTIECVKIFPENENAEINLKDLLSPSYGTGFCITADGYIVTNFHVINSSQNIKIFGLNNNFKKGWNAHVVIADERYDLALLKISDSDFQMQQKIPFSFNFTDEKEQAEVFTIGFPGAKTMPEKTTISNGIITSRTGVHGDISTYRTSVELIPGNSGGPLFNSKGNVTGIAKSIFTDAENVGFAVKSLYLKNMINLLEKKTVLPTSNSIEHLSLSEKRNVLSNFVCIVEVNHYFEIYDRKSSMKILSDSNDELNENSETEADADTYYSIALFQLNAKEYETSYSNIDKAIHKGLSVNYAYFLRGYLGAFLKKNPQLAISDMDIYMQNDTSNAVNLLLYRGEMHEMLGVFDSAITDYTKCLEKDSTVLEAWMRRGLLNGKLEKNIEAASDFAYILDQYKNSETKALAKIFLYKGENLMKAGFYDDALLDLNQSIEIDYADTQAWIVRGQVYYNLQKYHESIDNFNKAISIEETEQAYYWRGMALINSGKNMEGNKDIEKSKVLANNLSEKK